MAISIPSGSKKFRTAILPVAIWLFIIGMVAMVFWGGLIIIVEGSNLNRPALAFACVFASVCVMFFSFVGSWLLSLLYPYAFSAEGIYGISFWSRRRFVRWQDISSARTFRILNLQWLRVYGTNGEITWLALFLSQDTELRQVIRQFAPPASPILNHL